MTTPSPGLIPSVPPQVYASAAARAAATAAPSAQSVNSNVGAYTSTSGSGGVYMGTAGPGGQFQMPGVGQVNPLLTGGKSNVNYSLIGNDVIVPLTGITSSGPQYLNTTQANNLYYTWNAQQQQAFRNQYALVDSSALTATDAQLATAWQNLVAQSAAYAQAGVQNVSPWDVLAKDIASNNGGKGKANWKPITRTLNTVSYTSAADANALFTSAAQSLLGRAPTADELATFRNNLHGLEQANPTTETLVYDYNPGGYYTQRGATKTSGGISQAAQQNLALQQAKENPEYGAYQAATTYMGALQSLLSSGNVGG